jgi:hypothetical protein
MNNNQKIFEAVTGFKASWMAISASQDYNENDRDEIKSVVDGTIDSADLLDLDLDLDDGDIDANAITDAIMDFHACDTGCGVDLDLIFDGLSDDE